MPCLNSVPPRYTRPLFVFQQSNTAESRQDVQSAANMRPALPLHTNGEYKRSATEHRAERSGSEGCAGERPRQQMAGGAWFLQGNSKKRSLRNLSQSVVANVSVPANANETHVWSKRSRGELGGGGGGGPVLETGVQFKK